MATLQSSLPVVTFHDIGTTQFSTGLFKRCLMRWRAAGYQSLDLPTFTRALDEQLPEKSIVISFDDGYRSTYETAFPLLLDFGFKACLNVITGDSVRRTYLPSFEGHDMLSWAELREMQQAGFSIGSHTMTHPDLTRLSDAGAAAELFGSKQLLEDRLGVSIDSCAYPYGRHDERIRSITGEYYRCAFSDSLGLTGLKSNRLGLERVDMCFFNRTPLLRLFTGPMLVTYLRLQKQRLAVSRQLFGHPATAPV